MAGKSADSGYPKVPAAGKPSLHGVTKTPPGTKKQGTTNPWVLVGNHKG